MTHEDYVTFDQAMKLKDLGFDWKCNYYYEGNGSHPTLHESTQFYMRARSPYVSEFYHNFNDLTNRHGQPGYPRCSAPTLCQVQKWFMDNKKILISIRPNDFVNDSGNAEIHYTTDIFGISKGYLELLHSESGYENYEFALDDGINEALELLKNKN